MCLLGRECPRVYHTVLVNVGFPYSPALAWVRGHYAQVVYRTLSQRTLMQQCTLSYRDASVTDYDFYSTKIAMSAKSENIWESRQSGRTQPQPHGNIFSEWLEMPLCWAPLAASSTSLRGRWQLAAGIAHLSAPVEAWQSVSSSPGVHTAFEIPCRAPSHAQWATVSMAGPRHWILLAAWLAGLEGEVGGDNQPYICRRCTCDTKTGTVNCLNQSFNETDLPLELPTTTSRLVFVGNNLKHLGKLLNCANPATSNYSGLHELDLSNNKIRYIHHNAFECMPNLHHLILDNNDWFLDNGTTQVWQAVPKLQWLSLNEALTQEYNATFGHLTDLSWLFPTGDLPRLLTLYLERNEVWSFSSQLFCSMVTLSHLSLAHNNLAKPTFDSDCTPALSNINLANNSLFYLRPVMTNYFDTLKSRHSLSVNISDNPLQCDCMFNSSLKWIKSNSSDYLSNREDLVCRYPLALQGTRVMTLSQPQLVCKRYRLPSGLRTSYIIMGCLFTIIGILFLIVMYMNRNKIKRLCRDDVLNAVRTTAFGRESSHLGYSSVTV